MFCIRLLIYIMILVSANLSWSQSNKSRYIDLIDLSFALFEVGYFEIDPSKQGNIIPSFIDQIFLPVSAIENRSFLKSSNLSSSDSQIPMIVARLSSLSDKIQLPLRANSNKDYQICEFKLKSGQYAQLLFIEFDQNEYARLCSSVKSITTVKNESIWHRLLIPKAHALNFDPTCQQTSPVRRHRSDLQKVSVQVEAMQLVQRIGSCAADAIRSSLNSAGSAVEGVANSFNTLKKDPFELWNEITAQAKATVQFVLGIRDQVQQFASALDGLPNEMKWKLGCHLVGEATLLLGGMALTAWTGATAAALSVRLVEVFMQMQKASGVLKYVQQLVKLGKGGKANEAIQCLVR